MKVNAKNGEKIINFNLDDNKVHYTLGNGRKIAIDAGDMNLPQRIFTAHEEITEYLDKIKEEHNVKTVDDVKNMPTGDLKKDLAQLSESDKFVRDKLNRAFNTCEPGEAGWQDICFAAFGTANCISISRTTGNMYFEDFLEVVIYPIVEAEFGARSDTLKKQIDKYTRQKGKHSKK